jgi:hypothetical protein
MTYQLAMNSNMQADSRLEFALQRKPLKHFSDTPDVLPSKAGRDTSEDIS